MALNECKNLTDAAVDSLVRLSAFTELLVNGTQITKTGFERLRAAFPKAEIPSDL